MPELILDHSTRPMQGRTLSSIEAPCLFEVVAPHLHQFSEATPSSVEREVGEMRNLISPYRLDECFLGPSRCRFFQDMLSGETPRGYRLFNSVRRAYQHWFFAGWMPGLTGDIASAIKMMDNPDSEGAAQRFIERLSESVMSTRRTTDELGDMNRLLTAALSDGALEEIAGETDWVRSTTKTRRLAHDLRNILSPFLMNFSRAAHIEDPVEKRDLLDKARECDFSSFASAIRFVGNLHTSSAEAAGVELEIGAIPAVPLSDVSSVAFFRIMNELVTNAIKYRDPEKESRSIRFDSHRIGSMLYIHVIDNGLGIKDFDTFVQHAQHDGGWREYPHLADGDGDGVQSMIELAKKLRCGFFVASEAGMGTDVGLYFDTALLEHRVPKSPSLSRRAKGGASQDIFERLHRSPELPMAKAFGLGAYPSPVLNVGAINCFHLSFGLHSMGIV